MFAEKYNFMSSGSVLNSAHLVVLTFLKFSCYIYFL